MNELMNESYFCFADIHQLDCEQAVQDEEEVSRRVRNVRDPPAPSLLRCDRTR